MKLFAFISILLISACSSSQKTEQLQTSAAAPPPEPDCIQKLIKTFTAEEMQNPPRSIYSYTYNDSTVYYVPAICCDFFSDLYNAKCMLIGHPDGGFTGKGDRSVPDFFEKRKNEKLIWKDPRGK